MIPFPRGTTLFRLLQNARRRRRVRYRIPDPRLVLVTPFALHLSDQIKVGTTCMLHHAARVSKRTLLTCTSTSEPANVWPGSTFTTVLQVAAARAWTRTVVRNLRNASGSARVTSEEENTARMRKPLSGVRSNCSNRDTGSWLNGRRISPVMCVDSHTGLGMD